MYSKFEKKKNCERVDWPDSVTLSTKRVLAFVKCKKEEWAYGIPQGVQPSLLIRRLVHHVTSLHVY